MKPRSSKQLFFGIAIAVAVLAVIALAFQQVATAGNGTLHLKVAPADSTVSVDGKGAKPGDLSLSPGNHTISVSRSDFTTKTVTVSISSKGEVSQSIGLQPANASGIKYLQDNPTEEAQREGIGSHDAYKTGQTVTANNPLIAQLPYHGSGFDIDFGASPTRKDINAVAIFITTDTQAGRTNAVNWIRAKGFNPTAYELIFQTTAEANQ